MEKAYFIAMTITAIIFAGGMTGSVLAASNTFNITVNCLNGTQAHKLAEGPTGTNVNVNVNCSSTGGTPGIPGTNGKNGINGTNGLNGINGQNATITVVTTGSNVTSNMTESAAPHFSTPHFTCTSMATMMPIRCTPK